VPSPQQSCVPGRQPQTWLVHVSGLWHPPHEQWLESRPHSAPPGPQAVEQSGQVITVPLQFKVVPFRLHGELQMNGVAPGQSSSH
jgi:hypothetical protein